MTSSRRDVPGPASRPPATGARREVERRSAVLLVWLSQRPRWLVPLATAALLAGVVFLPSGPALGCLVVVVALVGWLSYLSWPAVAGPQRLVRVATLLLLLAVGVLAVS